MEWVCVYLTLVKNLPVLGVREEDYKTDWLPSVSAVGEPSHRDVV
jgi:hypothetical protein